MAAIFAASMSSLDSSINSMSTALTTDFYGRLRKSQNDGTHMKFARVATVAFGVVGTMTAAWLAWLETQSIWDQFLKILGLFGSGLAGMFMVGIFTRRARRRACPTAPLRSNFFVVSCSRGACLAAWKETRGDIVLGEYFRRRALFSVRRDRHSDMFDRRMADEPRFSRLSKKC